MPPTEPNVHVLETVRVHPSRGSKELFDTRVLSRDQLKLNEDLTDVFPEMIKVLGQQEQFQTIMEKSVAGESRQHRVSRALEESVMKFVMPVLDAMLPNGQVDLNAVPGSMPATVVLDGLFAKEMCKEVGALIKARFATPPDTCEEKYFTFPSQPDFVSEEYGGLEDGPRGDNYEQVFEDLMKLLRESEGPLSESDLNYLKDELMKDPNLLGLLSSDPEPGVDKMYGDLCSLLHLAAAGPAHDADLVDWMIQMGALIIQLTLHCRQEGSSSSQYTVFSDCKVQHVTGSHFLFLGKGIPVLGLYRGDGTAHCTIYIKTHINVVFYKRSCIFTNDL